MSLLGKVVSLCEFEIRAEEESPELGYAASMSFSRSAYENALDATASGTGHLVSA